MNNVLERFIEKEVIISTMNDSISTVYGIIKEVNEKWITIDTKNNGLDMINIEYITRIREYPVNKKGKKKTFF
ncbi:MAG: hypothetical protein IJP18_03080 [Oscillospiraceae bacterium]|nr:hypothetical protein [Oscillospiraceae bacterium]MBQ9981529.1 hypothetical protein [Oscillospiraceae bacterium]